MWWALRARSVAARSIHCPPSRRRVAKQNAELEFCTHHLSNTTYRCVPPDLRAPICDAPVDWYLDTLNKEVLARMQKQGEAFVSNAVIRGRYVLRACVDDMNTRASDMRPVAEISARMGRELDAELRPHRLARQ